MGNRRGLEYFEIDEETGDVSVRKSLLTDAANTKTYRVRAKSSAEHWNTKCTMQIA